MTRALRPPRRRPLPRRDDDRGVVAIVVAAMLVVFLGLAALVVDLGFAHDEEGVAQNAADAGALAAATCMASLTSRCNDTVAATAKARSYITANGWDGAGSTVTFDVAAQTVSVTLPARQSPTIFAGAIGSGAPAVARAAAATWNGAGTGCSLCVLNNVDLSANGDLTLDQGDLLVNGNLMLGPNSSVINRGGRIFANGSVTGGARTVLQDATGPLGLGAVPTTGPITAPIVDVSAVLGQPVAPNPSGACAPGTYAALDNCTSMSAGIYVVTGATAFTRTATIQATGATFVLTCSSTTAGTTRSSACAPGTPGGSIEIGGQATVNISVSSPPIYASICFGLAIVSDPNNTGQLWVHGSQAQLNVTGSVYLKSGTLNYSGGPDLRVAGNLVVGNYTSSGNPGTLHALGCGPGGGSGGGGVHLLH